MKSVLEIAGYFLYLAYLVVIAPIVSVLYILLVALMAYRYTGNLLLQLSRLVGRVPAALVHVARTRLMPGKKWQLGWHLHKAS